MRRLHWTMMLTGLLGACGGDGDGGNNGPETQRQSSVTINYWRHDNASYRKATDDAFAAYKATHPNVTIQDTTQPWQGYTTGLSGDLKRDQLMMDLILMPPASICTYADHLADV